MNFRPLSLAHLCLITSLVACDSNATASEDLKNSAHDSQGPFGSPDTQLAPLSDHLAWEPTELSAADRMATPQSPFDSRFSREKLKELMRPSFNVGSEWQGMKNGVGLNIYDARVQFPTFPFFGPPPPFIDVGFSYVDVDAPVVLDLPPALYQGSWAFVDATR